jgi:hypothetical protein
MELTWSHLQATNLKGADKSREIKYKSTKTVKVEVQMETGGTDKPRSRGRALPPALPGLFSFLFTPERFNIFFIFYNGKTPACKRGMVTDVMARLPLKATSAWLWPSSISWAPA